MLRRFIAQAPLPIVQAGLGLASVSVYSRLLDASDYGTYALLLSAGLLAHTLLFTWIEACAYRFQPLSTEPSADHFAFLRQAALLSVTTAFIVVLIASLAFSKFSLAIFSAGAALCLRFLSRIAREGERASGRVTRFVWREIAFHALSLPLGALLLWATPLGLAAPFLGMAAAASMFAIDDAALLWRRGRPGHTSWRQIWAYAMYGAPLALALAFDLFNQATLRAVTLASASPAEAVALAAAASLSRPVDIACTAIGIAYGPMLLAANAASRNVKQTRRTALAALLLFGGGAAIALSVLAGPLCDLALGASVRARATATLPWMALAAFFTGLALHYLSETLIVARQTHLRAACLAIAALAQIFLAWRLIPTFGAIGAGAAAAIAAMLGCALLFAATRLARANNAEPVHAAA